METTTNLLLAMAGATLASTTLVLTAGVWKKFNQFRGFKNLAIAIAPRNAATAIEPIKSNQNLKKGACAPCPSAWMVMWDGGMAFVPRKQRARDRFV